MKTAVSIPDEIFREADRVADQMGWSRSQLYARAVQQFVAQHEGDPVTEALDAIADEMPTSPTATARQLIDSGQWEW